MIGTLLVELSALAGIFGIAQPAVRNNLWQMVQPATIDFRANQPAPREFDQFAAEPGFYAPDSNVPNSNALNFNATNFNVAEPNRLTHPSAYTAQAVIPQGATNQSAWKASGYNPMGNYQ
jgi:hypothetical protein